MLISASFSPCNFFITNPGVFIVQGKARAFIWKVKIYDEKKNDH